jgi:glycosyltransferase involved in cell wall biosynthesis
MIGTARSKPAFPAYWFKADVMKILILSHHVPMPDRASGELRFYTFLKLLAESNEVTLCPFMLKSQNNEMGEAVTKSYISKIEAINIRLGSTDVLSTLKNNQFDLVIFEFYYYVKKYIDFIRLFQPQACVFVDSVDVHYNRLFSKAALTGEQSDYQLAKTIKQQELAAYRKADLTIVVTEDDGIILSKDAPNLNLGILSNIHRIPDFIPLQAPYNKLLFIGSFKHEPNIDAVLYFCQDIFPILLGMNPDFTLDVIGPNAPESILALQSDRINIRGFVESLDECYREARISVAPLRYGAGIKGKVGEALSFGLPVVTTEIGAEGFGLTSGENILIAQTPQDFANAILQLSQNPDLYKKLSNNGYEFIKAKYSEDATRKMVTKLLDQASLISKNKSSLTSIAKYFLLYPYYLYSYHIKLRLQLIYNTHIGWRFKHEW